MRIECETCGQKYKVDESLIGTTSVCVKCQSTMVIRDPQMPAVEEQAGGEPAPEADFEFASATDVDAAEAQSSDTDEYGLAEETLDNGEADVAAEEAEVRERRRSKPKRKKAAAGKSATGISFTHQQKLIAGVAAGAVGLLLMIVGLFVPAVAIGWGVLLMLAGMVLFVWGQVLIIIHAFQEDVTCGLCYVFLPIYPLYYVLTRKDEVSTGFLMILLGMLSFLAGMMILAFATSGSQRRNSGRMMPFPGA